MEELVHDLVYATFVAQMYLFAVPVIGAFWFLIKEATLLPPHQKKEEKTKPKPLIALEPELLPLNCPNCGGGVPLNEASMNCPRCRTVFPVPPEYEEIRQARNVATAKIKQAQKYWRLAHALTSNWTLTLAILLTVWLTASLILILTWVGTPLVTPFDEFIEVYQVPVLTLIFWIATLGFIAISISLKFRRDLPEIKKIEASTKAEITQCKNCGGAIGFEAGQFGALCGYCGVDTYRVKVARKSVQVEDKAAEKASDSLSIEMGHFQEAVEEFLALPTILVTGVIILVVGWGLVTVGFIGILTVVVWTIVFTIVGLAYYPIPTIIGIVVLGAMIYFRIQLFSAIRSFIKR